MTRSDTFTPATLADQPPQGTTQVRAACHTIVKTRDYVFTDYGKAVNKGICMTERSDSLVDRSMKRTSWRKTCGPCSWRRLLPHRDRAATLSIGRCEASEPSKADPVGLFRSVDFIDGS